MPVRRHAHQQVGSAARAQLTGPARQILGRLAGEVAGERGHLERIVVLENVRLGDDPAEPSDDDQEAVEGTATEIDEEPINPNAGRRERAKKRKRKRRQ